MSAATPKAVPDSLAFVRLWCHECMRVFSDRLINDADMQAFHTLLNAQLEQHFRMDLMKVTSGQRLLYADFMVPGADPKQYEEVIDTERLTEVVKDYLGECNRSITPSMPLFMFMDAIEHVVKVCRTLRQHDGRVLLLGVGGSGRRSIARLSIMICEYETFQVEMTKHFGVGDWKELMRQLLLGVGLEEKQSVLLMTDTQIVNELFLEDISGLLNNGDVPNLFDASTLEDISTHMRPICTVERLPTTKVGLYARFIQADKALEEFQVAMETASEQKKEAEALKAQLGWRASSLGASPKTLRNSWPGCGRCSTPRGRPSEGSRPRT